MQKTVEYKISRKHSVYYMTATAGVHSLVASWRSAVWR